tara:strand:+ start:13 stop:1119 length:1107 start_codon:yes stop_codon:yes gene_type:complete
MTSMTSATLRSIAEITDHLESTKDKAIVTQARLTDASNILIALKTKKSQKLLEMRECQTKFEEKKKIGNEQMEQLNDSQKNLEKYLGKRNLTLQKRDMAVRKIRELGTVNQILVNDKNYKDLSSKKLIQMIKKCNEKLSKFTKVNKKALNQYVSFDEQQQKLLEMNKQIEKGDEAIQELLRHLDLKKDEAILATFRAVQKHFRAVFKELVPSGQGALILRRKDNSDIDDDDVQDDMTLDSDDDSDDSDDDSDDSDDDSNDDENGGRRRNSKSKKSKGKKKKLSKKERKMAKKIARAEKCAADVESFVGVDVKVTFSGEADTSMTKRLSGGQKDIVALALILAIQRCDPGPFYLFDELDAALDDVRRGK